MTLLTTARLGPYVIVAPLGAGGMGEVYRAIDTRLDRTVAIKVLRGDVDSPSRRERFEREARAVSRLNHPHISALYDVGEEHGLRFLVMEYIEGETLARRLRRGPLPLQELLQCAIQIVDALDHAHRAGIVHRDLKPANVMLTRAGAKLLDFGVAHWRIGQDTPGTLPVTSIETLTEDGTVVGTTPYMAPEQLEGATVDARSDIFAFGALIYEMATGCAAFDGASKAGVIGAVLRGDPPPLTGARREVTGEDDTPPFLDQIVARCLAKHPDERWQTASDLRQALKWVDGSSTQTAAVSVISTRATRWLHRREYLAWGLAFCLVVVLAAVSLRRATPQPLVSQPVVRTAIVFPSGENLSRRYDRDYPLALSPDGSRLAYVAGGPNPEQLYVRDLSEFDAKPIPATTGARHPFFSPDGQWIAFFAGNALHRVPVTGGAPVRICDVPGIGMGGSWGRNDTIVFAASGIGLFKVPAAGGAPQRIGGTTGGQWPDILPDDKTVLFTLRGVAIAATSLDGSATRTIARAVPQSLLSGEVDSTPGGGPAVLGTGTIRQARFLPTGHIIYGQDPGAVRAVPFDLSSLALKGSPVSLVDGVYRASNGGGVYFAVSWSGLLVYAPENRWRTVVWVDWRGRATPIGSDREAFRIPRLSADGRRIAVVIDDETRRSDIWMYDAISGTRTRLTSEKHNLGPVWTPDGTQVTHTRGSDLVLRSADASGPQRMLISNRPAALVGPTYASSWSANGRHLVLWAVNPVTGTDLWAVQDGTPRPLLVSAANEKFGVLSPDGNSIAYMSDESGRDEVYVARYPNLLGKAAVSNRGGGHPMWSSDGRELFYRQGTAMMAVAISTSGTGRAAAPRFLFDDPSYVGASGDLRFDVSPDGQRFLMVKSDDASASRQLVVVHNWSEEVKRRVTARQD